MTCIVVTGASGFVGSVLTRRLLDEGLGGRKVERLVLMDLNLDHAPADARIVPITGSIAEAAVRAQAWRHPVDAVFHLASVPGGAAEKNYALGRSINLDATLGLLEDLQQQTRSPRFVFASTVAVYGAPLPTLVDESTLPAPRLSYGAHKLAGEVLVADATRLGWVQGCSLRLPGVVARPGDGAGMMSAFMSQLFWKLAAGEALTVPVSPRAMAWWISVDTCVDNLLHAATIDPDRLDAPRCYQMPVLHLSVGDLVAALAAHHGADRLGLVHYAPDEAVERNFGAYPPLRSPKAESLGFRHDGTVANLIARATAHGPKHEPAHERKFA
jgi:nucleoside-diphosphate-sugar epimerase